MQLSVYLHPSPVRGNWLFASRRSWHCRTPSVPCLRFLYQFPACWRFQDAWRNSVCSSSPCTYSNGLNGRANNFVRHQTRSKKIFPEHGTRCICISSPARYCEMDEQFLNRTDCGVGYTWYSNCFAEEIILLNWFPVSTFAVVIKMLFTKMSLMTSDDTHEPTFTSPFDSSWGQLSGVALTTAPHSHALCSSFQPSFQFI